MNVDVLVIGAGPAGASAAALLHKAGFEPLVVERQRFPRFVIGESLLPRCMDLLAEADLLDAVRDQKFLVKTGAVFFRNGERCAFSFAEQHTQGWDYTYQVPRADFDKTLTDTVEARGVPILWGHSLSGVDFTDAGPVATVVDGHGERIEVAARFVLDGSGYGRVLPRLLDLEVPSTLPPRRALFTHVTGARHPEGMEGGRIWICLLPGNAWIWIIPFSNGKTSVGVVADPGFFDGFAGSDDDKLRQIIRSEDNAARRLAGCQFAFPARSIGGYSVSVKTLVGKDFALLGNATEFLDPVFSSGVTLALESANRAAKILCRHLAGERVDWEAEYAQYMMQGVDTFRTYVQAWYDDRLPTIFFSPVQPPEWRAQICSVLAGYVWDTTNPCVRAHARAVDTLARVCSVVK